MMEIQGNEALQAPVTAFCSAFCWCIKYGVVRKPCMPNRRLMAKDKRAIAKALIRGKIQMHVRY